MFKRLWVQILAPYTGRTLYFFSVISCKICIVCLKRPKINLKEAGVGPFEKKFIVAHLNSENAKNNEKGAADEDDVSDRLQGREEGLDHQFEAWRAVDHPEGP